ncbi:MAG TPA: tetratricopeptide repeat protein [Phototrophicaceae bacterium]|jgi:tetratricopeptide (TPR) repeat protein|nr:tetratricopeptide repeat protein [Phototrophicaceae bacterium]
MMSDTLITCDVFISHAVSDDIRVDQIGRVLKNAGLDIRVDHNHSSTTKAEQEADRWQALVASKIGLIVLSKAALNDDGSKKECEYYFNHYQDNTKQMLVVLLEHLTSDELPYSVNAIPYINMTDDFEGQIPRLIDAIQGRLTLDVLTSEDYPPDAPTNILAGITLYTTPDQIREAPIPLTGRGDDLATLFDHLEQHKRVLIQAPGGVGKTALAATAAAMWLRDYPDDHILWIRAGSASTDEIFNAIGRQLRQSENLIKLAEDEKPSFIHNLLGESGIKLIVLDNCWNDVALVRSLSIIPEAISVLITSQQRYVIEAYPYRLRDLTPDNALKLLNYHAQADLTHDSSAVALCDDLGNRALAIRLAGRMIAGQGWTAEELRQELLLRLKRLIEIRSSSVAIDALIDICLTRLDATDQTAFMIFGAFESPILSPRQLTLFLFGEIEVDEDMKKKARLNIPELADADDEAIIQALRRMFLSRIDIFPGENRLKNLAGVGLIDLMPSVAPNHIAYEMHDQVYAFALNLISPQERERAVYASLRYAQHHEDKTPENFSVLLTGLESLLSAMQWCFDHEKLMEAMRFIGALRVSKGILEYGNYYPQSIEMLEQVIKLSQKADLFAEQIEYQDLLGKLYLSLGNHQTAIEYFNQTLDMVDSQENSPEKAQMLTNLGHAFARMGQYRQAVNYFERALPIARAIGSKHGESFTLGLMGNACTNLGDFQRAIDCHQQALAISRSLKDKQAEATDLGNLGNAYKQQKQYRQAISHYEQALAVARVSGDRSMEGGWLGNLGSIHAQLGEYAVALDYHEQALAIFRALRDKQGEAIELGSMGLIKFHAKDYPGSNDYYNQGLTLARSLNDVKNEGITLMNLGSNYYEMKDYPRAIDYYKQALAIFRHMESQQLIASALENILRTAAQMKQSSN